MKWHRPAHKPPSPWGTNAVSRVLGTSYGCGHSTLAPLLGILLAAAAGLRWALAAAAEPSADLLFF